MKTIAGYIWNLMDKLITRLAFYHSVNSCDFCPVMFYFAFFMSVEPHFSRTTTWLLPDVFRTLIAVSTNDYSKNVLSVSRALHFRFTRYLYVTRPVMTVNWALIVLYLFGNRAVITRFIRSAHQMQAPRVAVVTTFIMPHFFSIPVVRLRYL